PSPRIGLGFFDGAEFFSGDIAEILVFGRALTTTERGAAMAYLNQKFALVSSAPLAPSNLTATAASPTQINLSWSNASAANVEIERKTGAGGTYALIATVGPASTTYADSGLVSGFQYFYRVRASDLGGISPYSNEASAL